MCAIAALGHTPYAGAHSVLAKIADSDADYTPAAISALAALGDEQSRALLRTWTFSGKESLRLNAIEALAKMGDEHVLDGIMAALNKSGPEAAYALITALGSVRHPRAESELIRLLEQGPRRYRSGVIRALGQQGSERATRRLLSYGEHNGRQALVDAVYALGGSDQPFARQTLLYMASDEEHEVSEEALAALLSNDRNDPDVNSLMLGALQSESEARRSRAIAHFGHRRDHQVVPDLLAIAEDTQGSLAHQAIHALSSIGGPEGQQAIRDLARQPGANQQFAVDALVNMPIAREDKRSLASALIDEDGAVSLSALRLLGNDPHPDAVRMLYRAAERGGKAGTTAIMLLEGRDDPDTTAFLSRLASSGEPRQRAAALRVLGTQETPAALSGIKAAMREEDPQVWGIAASALVSHGSDESEHALIAACEHDDPQLAEVAVTQLGMLGSDTALAALERLAHSEHEQVQNSALKSLMSAAPNRASAVLESELERTSPDVLYDLLLSGQLPAETSAKMLERVLTAGDSELVARTKTVFLNSPLDESHSMALRGLMDAPGLSEELRSLAE